ncbi:unnamed protein product [Linum tenue]|uniref:Uncharacterized protein n=1 Tax=Linum tenue TaxID=586396 RepID=A0AAV0R5Q6_9ROSI|nr:unnamed protein product [Linum tenue]
MVLWVRFKRDRNKKHPPTTDSHPQNYRRSSSSSPPHDSPALDEQNSSRIIINHQIQISWGPILLQLLQSMRDVSFFISVAYG